MIRYLLRSKIHRATVTEAHLDYVGSITIDAELMDQADICPYERVLVVDVDNGSRLETYAIEGSPGSGTIGMNGAAARLVQLGDRVIIMSFGGLDSQEAAGHRPRVVFVDERNRLQSVGAEDAVHDPFGVEATAGGSSTGDAR